MKADDIIDFLIIGAGKSGTTSLYYYLAQHPAIFLPGIKEPEYFLLPGLDVDTSPAQRELFGKTNPNSIASRNEYMNLFKDARPGQLRGEASIHYLVSDTAAINIGKYAASAKLICVLRNPVERAFSNFAHARRDKMESRDSILDVLRQDGIDHPYFYCGFYARHLDGYARYAAGNKMHIFLYDELMANSTAVIKDIFRFLEIDDTFVPDTSFKANVSGEAGPGNAWAAVYDWARRKFTWRRHPIVQKLLPVKLKQTIIKLLAGKADADRIKLRMTPTERESLLKLYEEDIRKLEGILGRDLSHWRRLEKAA